MTEEQKNAFMDEVNRNLSIMSPICFNQSEGSNKEQVMKVYHNLNEVLVFALGEETTQKIYNWMKDHNFCAAPASTRFHGACEKGLFFHTYEVIRQSLILSIPLFKDFWNSLEAENYEITVSDIIVSAFFHDFCKVNLYESYTKKLPNELGNWVPTTAYKCRQDNRNLGHGNESVLILIELLPQYISNKPVLEAISRHMGFSDLSESETYNYSNFLQNPLVILLQTADQIASAWYKF